LTKPPSVSAVLLTYNCVDFVGEAVRSVLDQDCAPMEVLISDDASDDGTLLVVEELVQAHGGPHQVTLRRRSSNSGSKSAHLNDVFHRTSGDILVSFDGDDVSHPGRVRRIVQAFREEQGVHAVYSSFSLIDGEGRRAGRGRVPHPPEGTDPARWFARVDAYAAGGTLAVSRKVLKTFGLLDPSIHEDVVLPFRASLLGKVRYLDEDLVQARRWAGSLTAVPERYASIEAYRVGMRAGIEKARRHLDSRLEDLERATGLMLDRQSEFEELAAVARETLKEAEATEALVSGSFLTRMRALAGLARSEAYRDQLPQHAALALCPGMYLWYKRRSLSRERPAANTRTEP
jgi:glycosyltransferase involved in cell wall biosynthesis